MICEPVALVHSAGQRDVLLHVPEARKRVPPSVYVAGVGNAGDNGKLQGVSACHALAAYEGG